MRGEPAKIVNGFLKVSCTDRAFFIRPSAIVMVEACSEDACDIFLQVTEKEETGKVRVDQGAIDVLRTLEELTKMERNASANQVEIELLRIRAETADRLINMYEKMHATHSAKDE